MADSKEEIIKKNVPEKTGNKRLSDEVMIEIVHAFKDIIIEFINHRYSRTAN